MQGDQGEPRTRESDPASRSHRQQQNTHRDRNEDFRVIDQSPTLDLVEVERRPSDGAILVKVHSRSIDGGALPDAVFAFRSHDPQYRFWEQRLREREREQVGE
jgi:hypothetical protein